MGKKRSKTTGCSVCGGQYNVLVQDPSDWCDKIQPLQKKPRFAFGHWLQRNPTAFVRCLECGSVWQLWYSSFDGSYSKSRKLKGRQVASLQSNSAAEQVIPLLSSSSPENHDLARQWLDHSDVAKAKKLDALLRHLIELIDSGKLDNNIASRLCPYISQLLAGNTASFSAMLVQLKTSARTLDKPPLALANLLKTLEPPKQPTPQPQPKPKPFEEPSHNPLKQLKQGAIITVLTILFVLFTSQFYAEENIQTGTWATAGVTNICMPFFLWWVFKEFKWTHARSAMIYIAVITVSIAIIGHRDFYHDSIRIYAKLHREAPENNQNLALANMNDVEVYQSLVNQKLASPSHWLFFDHLRFRAQYGTWSTEKAYYHGPMIEVYRQGFWVWFNWLFQLLILWLVGALMFLLAGPKVKR